MKKIFISFAVLVFLVPSVSFAQTTSSASNISALKAELAILEQELAALLAQPSTNTAVVAPVPTAQITGEQQTSNYALGTYSFSVAVTNTASTTIYVPLSTNADSSTTPGFAYSVNEPAVEYGQSSIETCPDMFVSNVSSGYIYSSTGAEPKYPEYCVVAPGATQTIQVSVILQAEDSGNYNVSPENLAYAYTNNPAASDFKRVTLTGTTSMMYLAPFHLGFGW